MRPALVVFSLAVAACSPDRSVMPDRTHLPPAAIAAFQAHIQTLGQGNLVCSDTAIDSAARVGGYINDDSVEDYAIETRALACSTRDDAAAVAYFCGRFSCAFPALISRGTNWDVVPLMVGNQVEVRDHYQETRFVVRQVNFGDPGGDTVLVREYAWREDQLTRVAEYPERSPPS